jgi:tetratricopeptide (TPR) repeat protein
MSDGITIKDILPNRWTPMPGAVVRLLTAALSAVLISSPAAAQSVPELVATGVTASDARNPVAALRDFQAAMAVDSTSYEANWRASIAVVDIGKQTPDSIPDPARDSLYRLAERYATRAVAANPAGADGWFALANAIGRTSLTLGKKERVQRAAEIRTAALKAIEINPQQDGAFHVMGRWNAEIMRLSGFQRFFAKSFLGGAVFSQASWDNAVAYMLRAVALRPEFIYHHYDLALIYLDTKHWASAREQLEIIPSLPLIDVMDPVWKQEAASLLLAIANKK